MPEKVGVSVQAQPITLKMGISLGLYQVRFSLLSSIKRIMVFNYPSR